MSSARRLGLYVSHPDVAIDPHVPVQEWRLNAQGLLRAKRFGKSLNADATSLIVSSAEQKACDLAKAICAPHDLPFHIEAKTGENDRQSTGFLPPEKFEAHADAFFAAPNHSIAGWEKAIDAQMRICEAVQNIVARNSAPRLIVFCGHGGVGTLLKCHLAGKKIDRREDQGVLGNGKGGNLYWFDLAEMRLLCDWTDMDQFDGVAPWQIET